MTVFHEIRFPLDISLHSSGGPERRTDVVTLGSNREMRNARWANSRRAYQAGYGVKSFAALAQVLSFFEERRGRLYGFRWRDRLDYKSCSLDANPAATDQVLGVGDGVNKQFQLAKTYGQSFAPYIRIIQKPVTGTLLVAVNGIPKVSGADFTADFTTGVISFTAAPASAAQVTAGFQFDVPVRFDTNFLDVDYSAFQGGQIPKIPIVEIIP